MIRFSVWKSKKRARCQNLEDVREISVEWVDLAQL